MKAIVLVDKNWGIAKDGKQIAFVKRDLQHFQKLTTGNTVIMGRKTFDALPDRKPLKNRRNIVITSNLNFAEEGVEVCHSMDELHTLLLNTEPNTQNVWVIGGELMYSRLIGQCDEAYVTMIPEDLGADQFFPNLDLSSKWELDTAMGYRFHEDGHNCTFAHYKRLWW